MLEDAILMYVDKMAAILQTTFSNSFSCMNIGAQKCEAYFRRVHENVSSLIKAIA